MRTGKDFLKRMRKVWKDSVSDETISLFENVVLTAASEEEAELEFVGFMDKLLDEE